MSEGPSVVELPKPVRIAAGIFVAYGVAVVINAVVWQSLGGWQEAADFPRAVVRLLGMGLIAWGLHRRARWAWWLGVALPGFWILMAAAGVVAYLALVGNEAGLTLPLPAVVFAAASALALTVAVLLLFTRDARAVFGRPRE